MIRCVLAVLSWCAVQPWCHHGAAGQSNNLRSLKLGYYGDAGDGGFAAANHSADDAMDVFRLPTSVRPVSYELQVATDFERMTYAGRVTIVFKTSVSSTDRLVLNSKDLRVTGVAVTDQKTNTPNEVRRYYAVDKNEQLVIELNCSAAGCLTRNRPYVVDIAFEAPLRDDMSGYYKSSYTEDNAIKWLAVTKFEPTHARRAFPCFDEPALKAPFTVSLKRRYDQIALSNMPLLNSTKVQGTNAYWDRFQETPPLSTYLVAFFVGEFYTMKTRTLGIYTHKKYIKQAEYVADESVKLLEAMENYTGIGYMLPKIDLLAIPDFAAGAMENWGLNTYRERLLLATEKSKTKVKEFVTTVVQHELSHQWFGDLVTCAWWDYLWLNEGFATFFEYFATKTVEPAWRLEDVFVYEVHQSALETDQTPMHPISGSVQTPAEIRGMFDDISYSKAGAVLRMLLYTVTEVNFKGALNFYLESNKYAAATPEDLWTAFENVLFEADFEMGDNVTVTKFIKCWTEQSGYPLIRVRRANNTFVVTQERFLIEPTNEIDTSQWIVGLTYTTEDQRNFTGVVPTAWLTGSETVLSNQSDTGWYIFNLQSIGFYRVNYEPYNWNALINQLYNDCTAIHVLNRAQLIDDAFNLARAKELDYILVLMLSEYLKKEDDVMPWYSAKSGFEHLLRSIRRCPHSYKNVKIYVGYLAGLIYAKTEELVTNHPDGLAAADHSAKAGWNAFSRWACSLGDKNCMKMALGYFNRWNRGIKIPADIKDAVFCAGVKYGGPETWDKILGVYVNSESASDRQSAQLALACSEDLVILSKYLDFMFDGYDGPIRPQDFRVIYQTLAATPQGISALIEFLTTKLDKILDEIINGKQVATAIYSLLASRVATKNEIMKIDELRGSPAVPKYLQVKFNTSFSVVGDNLDWFRTHHKKIGEWAKNTVHKLGLDEELTSVDTTEVNPTTQKLPDSNDTPTVSGAGPSNRQSFLYYFISSTLIIISVLHFV